MKKAEQESRSGENILLDLNADTEVDTKRDFKNWIKLHKKQLAFVGLSSAAIVGLILGAKNKDILMELWMSLIEKVGEEPAKIISPSLNEDAFISVVTPANPTRTYTSPKEPVHVDQFIRRLPIGWHHSEEKAAEARALGIQLLPHQTLVNSYTKYAA